MSPPRKDPIPNQDSTRIITPKDPIIPPLLSKRPTGHKPFIDDTHFSNKKKTNITILQIIHVPRKKSMNKRNVEKDEDKDDGKKEDN